MSNNFFNFNLPAIIEKYSDDWDDFKTEMQENFDYYFALVWNLYTLRSINKMTSRLVQRFMDLRQISYTDSDTLSEKKYKIRHHVSKLADKGLADVYLDAAEDIVGTRGVLYNGVNLFWRWNYSVWPDSGDNVLYIKWPNENPAFTIFFDVKTSDSDTLDQLVDLLREDSMLPGFYKMYLVDSTFTILRVI